MKIGNFKEFHNTFKWKKVQSVLKDSKGQVIFNMDQVEVPKDWSQLSTDILAQKYLRRTGVPTNSTNKIKEENIPEWLLASSSSGSLEAERSAIQVFHRLAGCWTYWGYRYIDANYFKDEKDAWDFYCNIFTDLYNQIAAPNSPQWFNTGLSWAYGIVGESKSSEYFIAHPITGEVTKNKDTYERALVHACFLTPTEDSLSGIMEHTNLESKIFKMGAGSGSNYSKIRGKDEKLSGGGVSSGLMSFLKIPDISAGAIKSGGRTRRSARMVIIDATHPEIEDFIGWKVKEEYKVASIVVGSRILDKLLQQLYDATDVEEEDDIVKQCKDLEVPESYVIKALDCKLQGIRLDSTSFDTDYRNEAYNTVSGQNSNNSILLTNKFMKKATMNYIPKDVTKLLEDISTDNHESPQWPLYNKDTNTISKVIDAKELLYNIAKAAWNCADPGLLFDDTINDWHTCIGDGRIDNTNPCGEYLFLTNTSCNLASHNLIKFISAKTIGNRKELTFDYTKYSKSCRRWIKVLDISVLYSQAPSKEIAKNTFMYRTLGLGYSNLGTLLMTLGLPYDSDEGRGLASTITSIMTASAYLESACMAKDISPFVRWDKNKDTMLNVINNHERASRGEECVGVNIQPVIYDRSWTYSRFKDISKFTENLWNEAIMLGSEFGYRNAQVTLLAPTGTISLLMGCNTTGVEPEYSLYKTKLLAGGGSFTIVNDSIRIALMELGYSMTEINGIISHIEKNNTIEGSTIKIEHLKIFDCAVSSNTGKRYISPLGHLSMMSAIQPLLSGAISKTINMPRHSTIEDVQNIFIDSNKLMIKAVAVYRDGSKLSQPLVSSNNESSLYDKIGKSNKVLKELSPRKRRRLPSKRKGYIQKTKLDNTKFYLHTGEYEDGTLGEIFVDLEKEGVLARSLLNQFAIAISLGLQYGVPLEEYVDAFVGSKFEPNGGVREHPELRMASSITDLIMKDLAIHYLNKTHYSHTRNVIKLDNQETKSNIDESAPNSYKESCYNCSSTNLQVTGTCKTCADCGTPQGGCS